MVIVSIICIVTFLALVINYVEDYYKKNKRVDMSFKEAMDLTELPVVTFYNGNKKLNFLLDTGSNKSYINSSNLPYIQHNKIEGVEEVIGIEGNTKNTELCEIDITYKNQKFKEIFNIHNMDDAFNIVKEESGVQIHGILGSLFFQKYKYIFDFETLVAYSKK